MREIFFQWFVGMLIVAFVLHRGYFIKKYQRTENEIEERPKEGNSVIACILFFPAMLGTILYLVRPMWMEWAHFMIPIWTRYAGIAIALLGFALMHWSQSMLGESWSDAPVALKDHQLVMKGPYQWIRHPIYTAFLLIFGSIILISANWLIGICWFMMAAIDVLWRIRVEEELMIHKFGEAYHIYNGKNRTAMS